MKWGDSIEHVSSRVQQSCGLRDDTVLEHGGL